MEFTLAKIEDFNEVQNLYWNLIDQSKDEPSFPDWKKGEHPSPELIMDSIKQGFPQPAQDPHDLFHRQSRKYSADPDIPL